MQQDRNGIFPEVHSHSTWPPFLRFYHSAVQVEQEFLPLIGWREWVSIPAIGIDHIKAKVDTGARTSALHTFDLETYEESGESRVRFRVHPFQGDLETVVACDLPVASQRIVRDSGGHEEVRPFIRVPVTFGKTVHEIEISLTNRDNMKFRMLIGRTALKSRFVVDSSRSYLFGRP